MVTAPPRRRRRRRRCRRSDRRAVTKRFRRRDVRGATAAVRRPSQGERAEPEAAVGIGGLQRKLTDGARIAQSAKCPLSMELNAPAS